MAEPQYVVIAGFPNADFMAVALDKDGVAISEKTFKPVDFMREMESFLEAYPAPEIRMIGPKDYAVEYKKMLIKGKYVTEHPGIPIEVLYRGGYAPPYFLLMFLLVGYVPLRSRKLHASFASSVPLRRTAPLTPLGILCVLRGVFCCVASSILKTKNSVSLQLFFD